MTDTYTVLKVGSKSVPQTVAGAIAHELRSAGEVQAQVIGAGAVNQLAKALAIANDYISLETGLGPVYSVPRFMDVVVDGERRTALRFYITTYKEIRA